ncbi:hypothetical protein K474DRAFT_1707442 [Panus rudis PR-1116 ss-1]|nr:hypothetical protein K474DRAFT_1707442 [Panus rudis PR-1116 ss-1]
MTEKKSLVLGGIPVTVYSNSQHTSRPVAVLFLLHGRYGSANAVEWVAESLLNGIRNREAERHAEHELLIVTFDHRNHGERLVNPVANHHWQKEKPEQHNERHAIDMYSIQVGTTRDVSFLIDFLPAYLYPNDEREISKWLVAGISLGGHSTWLSLRHEPRVTVGIPIIGM